MAIGSYREFLEAFEQRIWSVVRKTLWIKHCSDPTSHSEDVVSDVRRKVIEHWQKLEKPELALYKIIVTTASDHVRKCNAEVASEIHDSAAPCFVQAGRDPEEMLSDAILIKELLAELNPIERKVIELTFLGLSSAIIGVIMNMSPDTVRGIKKRAVDMLKSRHAVRAK